ncbi:unnamed protein product [Phytomonas sp. Hart1]|nr:unnamed protein product [Phytomonas sp. Hart1]|eukprot:CCW68645.1 unnamed protein product [Phytomonas sp. isolate Hart1]
MGFPSLSNIWKAKRGMLETEVAQLTEMEARLGRDLGTTVEAIEKMLSEHEDVMTRLEKRARDSATAHLEAMHQLSQREDRCRVNMQLASERIEQLKDDEESLQNQKNTLQENIIISKDHVEELQSNLDTAQDLLQTEKASLKDLIEEEKRMQDAAYGLTGEAKEMVMEMEKLKRSQRQTEVAAMETEVVRRELNAKCEEIKGSIRVFCRVKGDASPTAATCDAAFEDSSLQLSPTTMEEKRQRAGRRVDSTSMRSNHTTSDAGFPEENDEAELFTYSVSATQSGARASSSSKKKPSIPSRTTEGMRRIWQSPLRLRT